MAIIYRNKLSSKAMGGTELMATELESRLDPSSHENFQIFVSRVDQELDQTKHRVLWLHDLPGDPASEILRNGGWKQFHKLVFTSNWQMQQYIGHYRIPWSKCVVLQNAIEPIPLEIKRPYNQRSDQTIRLGYWSTPHRGLDILVNVFERLAKEHDNIELDVFSSFQLYGWPERDQPFEQLFEKCRQHPKINYHGSVSNQTIREHLGKLDIFAYPSIWPETSCLSLMEAMSAGLYCIHPNYAALFETAANQTDTYQWHEDFDAHCSRFYDKCTSAIAALSSDGWEARLGSQSLYADTHYNWDLRARQWEAELAQIKRMDFDTSEPEMFLYNTG